MFIKRIKLILGFITMISIVSIIITGCSEKNEYIEIRDYFPIDDSSTHEFEGTINYTKDNQIKKIVVQYERKGKSKVAEKEVYVEKQTYFDDSKNKILECEMYLNFGEKSRVLQFGKKVNGKLTWNDEPSIYLQSANIGDIYESTNDMTIGDEGYTKSNRLTIELKGLVDLNIGDKVYKDCLLVEKNFYGGKDIERKEQLYLEKDFGLIKYVEESLKDSYKIELDSKNK